MSTVRNAHPSPPSGHESKSRHRPRLQRGRCDRRDGGAIRRLAPDFDVLVVDDGSADATAEKARAAGAEVLRLPFNLGIGAAVQSGYVYAEEHGYEVRFRSTATDSTTPAISTICSTA